MWTLGVGGENTSVVHARAVKTPTGCDFWAVADKNW